MLISIAIPCYNSSRTLPKVVEEIVDVFNNQSEHDYQLILVNDGSPKDNTFDVIRSLCESNKKIVGVDLSRNFGQTSAKLAALNFVKGDCLVYMDDDGQHPAKYIIDIANKVFEGYDLVYAHFKNKKHSGFKKLTSVIHRKISEISGTKPKGIFVSAFQGWSRFAVDQVKKYKSPFPSTGGFIMKISSKVCNVEAEHRSRMEGSSGYNLKKLFNLWMNSLTNFSVVPLRLASVCGFIFSFLGLFYGLFVVIRKLVSPNIAAGYASIASIVLFSSGVIMMILGFWGEYLGRMYMIMNQLPQYVIRESVNSNEEE
ncbi:MAG: glycosyltransferase family 2 protein [Clostridia bacterium]|nr:glycosyltransferase family 2 protein [Clostridia bacterium]